MSKPKTRTRLAPGAYTNAKIVFEFFNNDDANFKNTALDRVAKGLRKEMNVSALALMDTLLEDPERGVLLVAFAAENEASAKSCKEKVLAYLDTNMPARIVNEDWFGDEF